MEILLVVAVVLGLALTADAILPPASSPERWIPQARVGTTTQPQRGSVTLRSYIPASLPNKPESVGWLL